MTSKIRPYLFIILIGLLLYSWTAFFEFSYLDDHDLIVANQEIISDLSNLGRIFTEDAFFSNSNFYYRPLLNVSFMLEAQLTGSLPWLYHLTNVFLHILVASLIFAVLRQLKVSAERSFWLAIFFLVHPALVQAVAWIPGRNDTLLAAFALASFLFFLRFLENRRISAYAACLSFFFLALFTKEAAVILPFLMFFYYLILAPQKLSHHEKGLFALGGLAAVFIWGLMRSLAIDGDLGSMLALTKAILENSPALIIGLGKFFLPLNLAIMPVLRDTTIVYGLIGGALISLLAIYRRLDKGWLAFGLSWFILFMLPSFVNPNPAEFYYLLLLEHRLYLPFIGLIFVFKDLRLSVPSVGVQEFPFAAFKLGKLIIKPIVVLAVLILLIFTTLSAHHLPNFKNQIAFWSFAVNKSPNSPLANRNLGAMFYFENRFVEAEAAYRRALEINPNEPMAKNNIGVIYRDRGDYEEAKKLFLEEMELKNSASYYLAERNLEYLLILQNRLR